MSSNSKSQISSEFSVRSSLSKSSKSKTTSNKSRSTPKIPSISDSRIETLRKRISENLNICTQHRLYSNTDISSLTPVDINDINSMIRLLQRNLLVITSTNNPVLLRLKRSVIFVLNRYVYIRDRYNKYRAELRERRAKERRARRSRELNQGRMVSRRTSRRTSRDRTNRNSESSLKSEMSVNSNGGGKK